MINLQKPKVVVQGATAILNSDVSDKQLLKNMKKCAVFSNKVIKSNKLK